MELIQQEHEKHPENPWTFPSPKIREMYHPDSIAELYEKILMDISLEYIRLYNLWHTFATMVLQNGVDVKTVSFILDTMTQASLCAPTSSLSDRCRSR